MTMRRGAIAAAAVFLAVNTLKVSIFANLLSSPVFNLPQCLFHSGIFIKCMLVCLVYILLWRFKRPYFFIVFYCLQAVYMFANLSYHSASEGYLHVTQYVGLFSEAFELIKHGAVPSNTAWKFIAIDIPLFAAILLLYPEIASFNRRFVFKKALFALLATLVFFSLKWQSVEAAQRPLAILDDKYSCDNSMVHKYGLLVFNTIDLIHLNDSKSLIKRLEYGREITGVSADKACPNIIMIQVESMDAHVINARHNNAWVTPFLHHLSGRSIYYPYVLSFHKAGSTSDCEFSVINGVEPFDDYPAMKLRDYEYPNSMLRPLIAAGYQTAAFHGNRGSYFNRSVALKKMGFMAFYDIASMGLTEKGWGASDGDVLDFVAAALPNQRRPFLYYIITMSSHEPFSAVNTYCANTAFDDIPDKPVKNYFKSMAYVDECLERFVRQTRKNIPNTFIFIYGDHTPPLDGNAVFKKASFIEDEKVFEFVPLFIVTPSGAIYDEHLQVALFLDFASTILPASNIDFKIRSSGKNLLAFSHETNRVSYSGEKYLRRDLFQRIRFPE